MKAIWPGARCVRVAGTFGLVALLGAVHGCAFAQGVRYVATGVLDAAAGATVVTPATPLAPTEAAPAAPDAPAPARTRGQVRFRTAAMLTATVGAVAGYGNAHWWQDGFTGRFKTIDEGWFGQSADNGGADKLGHAFFTYASTRLLRPAFEWAGHDSDSALQWSLWTSLGTMVGVELLDGFSRNWQFSKEDAVLNLAGAAMGYWLEKNPAADALVDFRLHYRPSTGPQGRRSFSPFGDYSGQTYLIVFKGSGVRALAQHPVLRYLEFSLGYGTRNYEKEARGFAAPARHAYAGISLNFSEILRNTAYKNNPQPSRTQRVTQALFEFVQVPGTAALADRRLR